MAWTQEQTSNCDTGDGSPDTVTVAYDVEVVDEQSHPNDGKQSPPSPPSTKAEGEDERRRQRQSTVRNMAVVCISFFLSMTACNGLICLQSSLNAKSGVGHNALTLLFIGPVVSNVLIASTAIRLFGYKQCMVMGLLASCAFPLSSFYPTAESLYTGASVTGLFGGVMWSAHAAYVTTLGKQYAALDVGHDAHDGANNAAAAAAAAAATISKFFGVFFMVHRASLMVGSLASSLMLQRSDAADHLPPDVVARVCGSSYCYQDLTTIGHWLTAETNRSDYPPSVNDSTLTSSTSHRTLYHPSSFQKNSLYAVYAACCLLAPLVLFVFLRQPAVESSENGERRDDDDHPQKTSVWTNVKATVTKLIDYRMILLLPIIVLNGSSLAFITTDFSVGFISCTVGIDSIGYIMATFGLVAAITAFSSGVLIKYTGRRVLFFVAAVWTLATLVAMWQWTPNSSEPVVLYAFAALWGACSTFWMTQLISYVGFLFRNDSMQPAMAAYYVVLNLSIGGWLVYARHLCLHSQLHLLMLLLAVGMAGYMTLEILVSRAEKNNGDDDDDVRRAKQDTTVPPI